MDQRVFIASSSFSLRSLRFPLPLLRELIQNLSIINHPSKLFLFILSFLHPLFAKVLANWDGGGTPSSSKQKNLETGTEALFLHFIQKSKKEKP